MEAQTQQKHTQKAVIYRLLPLKSNTECAHVLTRHPVEFIHHKERLYITLECPWREIECEMEAKKEVQAK